MKMQSLAVPEEPISGHKFCFIFHINFQFWYRVATQNPIFNSESVVEWRNKKRNEMKIQSFMYSTEACEVRLVIFFYFIGFLFIDHFTR